MKDGMFEDLSESMLPEDDFTPDMGSKYLLDGFDFDMDYNEGVLDSSRLPEARGLSGLPDGFLRPEDEDDVGQSLDEGVLALSDEQGMQIGEMLKESSLSRLDWLDPTQLPDLNRLPVNPVDLGIKELTEAWGDGVSNTGLELVPNMDREVIDLVHRSQHEGPHSELPNDVPKKEARAVEVDRIRRVAQQAMRLSTFGVPLKKVMAYATLELDGEAPQVLQAISEDHGLAGKVYIRAAAFPGMHNGKWDQQIKKKAARARYILADPGTKMAAFDNYLGKQVVSDIPWDEALEHYRPLLRASGVRLASGLHPKQALRKAFLSPPGGQEAAVSYKPVDVRPADRINSEDARRRLAQFRAVAQEKISKNPDVQLWTKVSSQFRRWTHTGFLTEGDCNRLIAEGRNPRATLKAAARLITSRRTAGDYDHMAGLGAGVTEAECSSEEALEALRMANPNLDQDVFSVEMRRKVVAHVKRMVGRGLLTAEEASSILSKKVSPKEMLRLASVVARTPHSHPLPETRTREFRGPILGQAPLTAKREIVLPSHQERILLAAKKSGIAATEISKLLRVARKSMNEGFAGNDLTQLLRVKFSGPLRVAGAELVQELREEHEGLAGHLYVDAKAYATARGVKGCEEGALRHRTTPIKYLLAMERCGSCVHQNEHGTCTKYKKALVEEAPVKDKGAYQREILRLADGNDSDRTAALFSSSNVYSPDEFGLQHDGDISLDEGPTNERLGEVLFGGMEIE